MYQTKQEKFVESANITAARLLKNNSNSSGHIFPDCIMFVSERSIELSLLVIEMYLIEFNVFIKKQKLRIVKHAT